MQPRKKPRGLVDTNLERGGAYLLSIGTGWLGHYKAGQQCRKVKDEAVKVDRRDGEPSNVSETLCYT